MFLLKNIVKHPVSPSFCLQIQVEKYFTESVLHSGFRCMYQIIDDILS